MKRFICTGILTATALAACVLHAQTRSNIYSLGVYASGTTDWSYCSFDSSFPPYHFKLSGQGCYQDSCGRRIFLGGHEAGPGITYHRYLQVEYGSESFTNLLEPGPPDLQTVGAGGDHSILAVVMQTGYPKSPILLTALVDGSASLCSTNGDKLLRGGQNNEWKLAARKCIAKASDLRSACFVTTNFTSPPRAQVRFYIITPFEVLTTDAEEKPLKAGRHQLSPLFQAAQDLIARIQQAQTNKKAER